MMFKGLRSALSRRRWAIAAGVLGGGMLIPVERKNFFHGTFTTAKDTADIMEFYSAEELLKIIAVHPLLVRAGLSGVQFMETPPDGWDAATWSPHTGMEVSFCLTEEEDAADPSIISYFQRHERFVNYLPGLAFFGIKVLLWDQTWNFGYRRGPDGVCEVYHHGESFCGPWPVHALVELHQRYVLWACSKHINSRAFGTDDVEVIDEQASNIPGHVFREFATVLHREVAKVLATAEVERVPQLTSNLHELSRLSLSDAAVASATMLESTHIAGGSGKVLGSHLALRLGDKGAQDAVKAALENINESQAVLQQLLANPEVVRPSRRWRDGKDGGKTAYFARLSPQERLEALRFAGVDTSGFVGRCGEGKVAVFAVLDDDVKSSALRQLAERSPNTDSDVAAAGMRTQ